MTDAAHRVLRVVHCPKYHAAVDRGWERVAFARALLVLCATCLAAAAVAAQSPLPAAAFALVAAAYWVVMRARLFNAVEAAVVCKILLLLAVARFELLRRGGVP